MPVIRISEDNFQRLQRWAIPLEDTVDSALAKVLTAAEADRPRTEVSEMPASPKIRPERTGEAIPDARYYALIIRALSEAEGRASKSAVTRRIGEWLASELSPDDHVTVATGESRWENRVAWARNRLRESGYLRADSPRGMWELTPKGRELASSERWPRGWFAPSID
ncbi:MAG: winged helix-turn-helix domain-containing protein [Chloroflexota bacterium]